MGGMISATVLAIFFVPLFFVLVRRRFPLRNGRNNGADDIFARANNRKGDMPMCRLFQLFRLRTCISRFLPVKLLCFVLQRITYEA